MVQNTGAGLILYYLVEDGHSFNQKVKGWRKTKCNIFFGRKRTRIPYIFRRPYTFNTLD